MEGEEHEHHDEGDDDDVPEADPVSFRLRRGRGRAFAENAAVIRHRSAGRLPHLTGFVVQLLVVRVPDGK